MTIHWINENVSLRSALLDLVRFVTPRTCDTTTTLISHILSDWGLSSKILCVTTDNASEVMKGMRSLKNKVVVENCIALPDDFHVRCKFGRKIFSEGYSC